MGPLFTTVSDGNLALHVGDDPEQTLRNRGALAARLGIDSKDLLWMNQVHGNTVVMATAQTPQADGLIADQSGLAVAVLVADCVPLLLSSDAGVVAAVHVGRRGLVNQVARNAIALMKERGATRINGVLGPAICGSCYEVPLEMQQDVCAISPAAQSTTRAGTPGLDIRHGLFVQLSELGVDSQIDQRCTRESEEFYSYRRDPHCGRFAGVIMVP